MSVYVTFIFNFILCVLQVLFLCTTSSMTDRKKGGIIKYKANYGEELL